MIVFPWSCAKSSKKNAQIKEGVLWLLLLERMVLYIVCCVAATIKSNKNFNLIQMVDPILDERKLLTIFR